MSADLFERPQGMQSPASDGTVHPRAEGAGALDELAMVYALQTAENEGWNITAGASTAQTIDPGAVLFWQCLLPAK